MKITDIKQYKGSTFEVGLDDGRRLYLHADIIADNALSAGRELDRAELKKIVYASNFRRAYQYSLYCLDYRDYSAEELFEKLVGTYKNESLCLEVIKKLARAGLIDDKRYAEKLARKLVECRKYGLRRAADEMRRKGLSDDVIDDSLAIYAETAAENLRGLISGKYSRFLTDSSDRKSTEKVKNALARMGYPFDDINRAVKEYFGGI